MDTQKMDVLKKELKGDLYLDVFRRKLLATDARIFKQMPCAVAGKMRNFNCDIQLLVNWGNLSPRIFS